MPKLNPLPFLRGGVAEGKSANQAFRDYQAAARQASDETGVKWTAGNRATFLGIYSGMLRTRATVPEAMSAPLDVPGGGLRPVPRPATRPGGYLQSAKIFFRELGTSDVQEGFYMARSNELLTPQEIANRVQADFETSAADEHGSMYRHVIEGIVYGGAEQLVPFEQAPF